MNFAVFFASVLIPRGENTGAVLEKCKSRASEFIPHPREERIRTPVARRDSASDPRFGVRTCTSHPCREKACRRYSMLTVDPERETS
jgi:hypothetical protein